MPSRTSRRTSGRTSRRTVALCAAAVAALLASPLAAVAPAAAATKAPIADFNGDGYADLVINAPYATVAGTANAGYVSVVYGSSAGADTAHPQNLSLATSLIPGEASASHNFGMATAARDLDGDGYSDLVVGGYNKESSAILWGSAAGLSKATTLAGAVYDVVGGDFNGDGKGDLAVKSSEGLQIRLGPFSRSGVPADTSTLPVDERQETWDIAAGDMNGDGKDDLVTTHGFEERSYKSRWWPGTSTGVSSTYKTTGYYTVGGVIADVDQDGYGDYVSREVEAVSETMSYEAGTVRVVYGSSLGPSTRTKKITQDTAGVPGAGESAPITDEQYDGDQFGYSLAAGDVTGDGYPDIAVGVPGEDIGSIKDAGSVVLLKGSASGLTGSGAQAFNQSTSGVPGASETLDHFGASVTLADVNTNNRADLTVSAPTEDGTYQNSGAAWVFRGSKAGLTTTNITSFGPAALGAPEKEAFFGVGFAR
ncbi:FG-GAP and VCBS repeat-containing protein [Streptomyces phyllanthi]|uniref:FG-GAP and VCBS repeat-containing protein n=1 Tax=Streptomyces phyllanthi TaxID=1803180 RepID=UPI002AD4C3C4|nr:FG-GAP and VCBS repeat-containing protein [Streptomyces phyllanthi]